MQSKAQIPAQILYYKEQIKLSGTKQHVKDLYVAYLTDIRDEINKILLDSNFSGSNQNKK